MDIEVDHHRRQYVMNDKMYCIYYHRNKSNGKYYFGQTCKEPKHRWCSGNGYKNQSYFWNAIQKYGWDNFDHVILAQHLTKEQADYWQDFLIVQFRTNDPDHGYNIKRGGSCGSYVMPQSTKTTISRSKAGHAVSQQTRNKISNTLSGTKLSAQTKRKISEAMIAYNKSHKRLHTKRSEDAKKKTSASCCAWWSKNAKKIICIETCEVFNTQTQAASKMGISYTGLNNHLRGLSLSAGGYTFKYITQERSRS